jgi:L-alanine exporter
MRRFLADTSALILFSTVAALFTEVVIAGMTLAQSAQARAAAVPAMLLTARPYGIFRDWVFRASGAAEGGEVRRAVADIGAFVVFQVPVYVAILLLAGATPRQMATACGTAAVILAVSGRPYGLLLDFVRRLFGATDAAPE